jgi:hypothetical protein
MYNSITLVPAYGRDYKKKSDIIADWIVGKDFQIRGLHWDGSYTDISAIPNLLAEGVTSITFRYKKMTQLIIVDLSKTQEELKKEYKL